MVCLNNSRAKPDGFYLTGLFCLWQLPQFGGFYTLCETGGSHTGYQHRKRERNQDGKISQILGKRSGFSGESKTISSGGCYRKVHVYNKG
jgi:hypothetical protein